VRIVVQSINFAPEVVGVGKYSGEMVNWLAGRGHHICVITTPPFNPHNQIWQGYQGWKYQEEFGVPENTTPDRGAAEFAAGVRVVRCPLWVPRKPNGLNRILHLASFALSSWPPMLALVQWRPDVVILVEPTLLCALQALALGRLTRAKLWLHIQDFEVDAAFELGNLGSSHLRNIAAAFERTVLHRFDRVSTISERMMDRLKIKGIDPSRGILFPNWVDSTQIYPLSRPSNLRQEIGASEGTTVALYAGSMGKKQGLDLLLEVAARAADREDLLFVFCGQGAYRENIARAAQSCRNIRLLDIQPVEELNDLLNLADIHLLPQVAEAADLVMPSKLSGMLASGKPVIATAKSGTQIETVLRGRGVVVPPGDASAFLSALVNLARNKSQQSELGARGREYAVRTLDSAKILSAFERELMTLCETRDKVLGSDRHERARAAACVTAQLSKEENAIEQGN
jgi:colanic acid biosynthesis glycosyl transferase WcaI